MAKSSPRIFSHRPLEALAGGLWQVTGEMSGPPFTRNMIVYRLRDGMLLIHSAIAMPPEGMQALDALGRPRLLIVPNGLHRRDIAFYKARYPDARVICPQAAQARVERVIAVDATAESALPAEGIRWHLPGGLKPLELVYELPIDGGVALVCADLLFNLGRLPGFKGWLMDAIGSGGSLRLTAIGRLLFLQERAQFQDWLLALAATPRLRLIAVGHGAAVREDAPGQLRAAAALLR